MVANYKCPDCKTYRLKKTVYTEEFCDCGYVNHMIHRTKRMKEEKKLR